MIEKAPLDIFVRNMRELLEPLWISTHKSWDDEPILSPPSKYMCRYTCLFLQRALSNNGYGQWSIELGRPTSQELNGTKEGQYGYCTSDGRWYDHAWLANEDTLIDITADQYGDAPVIICEKPSPKHNANLTEKDIFNDLQKLNKRAIAWLEEIYKNNNYGQKT